MTKHISTLLTGLLLLVALGVNAQQYAKITYIHTEADGSVFAATDEDGNLEWKIDHYPFGSEIRNTATGRNNDLSYTGKPFDEEIGLSYYGARWYDPVTGRFTGIDPAPVDPDDYRRFNRYAYGFNSPYRYNDPDGRLPLDYAVDGISVGISAALFANDPSFVNGLGLAADTVLAVVPYVPAGVGLIRGGDKALDSARAVETGAAFPGRRLPRDTNGNPIPETDLPHTQLGSKNGRNGTYPQAREFDANGQPVRDIDFTDHGRANHPNPHVHRHIPNETGGTPKRSKTPEPLD